MYTLKTQGNKSGPEKVARRAKGAAGRPWCDVVDEKPVDAQEWYGFLPARRRAEELALNHHITMVILEDGEPVATVSPNLTFTLLAHDAKAAKA